MKHVLTYVIPKSGHDKARFVRMTKEYLRELTGDKVVVGQQILNKSRNEFHHVKMFEVPCELAFFAVYDTAIPRNLQIADLIDLQKEVNVHFGWDIPRDEVEVKAFYKQQVEKYGVFISEVIANCKLYMFCVFHGHIMFISCVSATA